MGIEYTNENGKGWPDPHWPCSEEGQPPLFIDNPLSSGSQGSFSRIEQINTSVIGA